MIPFTPSHRGGEGPPLVLLHGFLESWRSWELVLPVLERRHDVLALTLPGHAGGPPLDGPATGAATVDAVEAAMDAEGSRPRTWPATRSADGSRSRSPRAGGPARSWPSPPAAAGRGTTRPSASCSPSSAICSARPGRRAPRRRPRGHAGGPATGDAAVSERYEHIPAELLAHRIEAVASCPAAAEMIDAGLRGSWDLDAARIDVPVRIVWGTADRLLPWPSAAVRYRTEWLPQADWVVLDGVGHAPQLDVPLEAAELVLGLTAGWPRAAR